MGSGSRHLAKLSKPRLFDAMPRERLFGRLDALSKHPVAWISAPPGAGKSTLVATWLEARRVSHHWYHMDGADSDPATFFSYLVELARQRSAPRLPYLTAEYLADVPGFARRFFRQMLNEFSGRVVIVLDNCQEAETMIAEMILAVAQEIPEGICLMAISRNQPLPALARLVANRQLRELLPEHIKLTPQESGEMLSHLGIPEDSVVRMLHNRAEGWAAGLVLLAYLFKRTGEDQPRLASGSGESLFEYFVSESFGRMPEAERTVLTATALLPQVTPGEAITLTGTDESAAILERLFRGNFFIDRRTEPALSYRFHDLFREFLLVVLHRERSVEEVRELQLRAGRLAAARGDIAAAFRLMQEGGHLGEAARLIVSEAPRLVAQGRWKQLQEWIQSMPEAQLDQIPWLRFWQGIACMQTDLPASTRILEAASVRFEGAGDLLGQALCAAAIINAWYYQYNDFSQMDRWIDTLDRLVGEGLAFPEPVVELAVYSALVLAINYRMPKHRNLAAYVARTSVLVGQDIDVNQRVSAAIGLVSHFTFACDFVKGDALVATIGSLMKRPEVTALNRAFWWLVVGYFHEQPCGRLANGRPDYDHSDRIAAEHGLRQTEFLSRVFRAYSFLTWGDASAAKAAVEGALPLLNSARTMDTAQLHLAMCFVALANREPAAAARHAKTCVEAATKVGAAFFSIAWKAIGPIALVGNGEYVLAKKWLDEAWQESEGTFLANIHPLVSLVRSYLLDAQGHRADSLVMLRRAIVEAKACGYSYLYWGDQAKHVMLVEAMRHDIESDYLRTILPLLRVRAPETPLEAWPWPVKIYVLGGFRLLVDGQPVEFARKTPRKPLALLKALVALGGRNVSERKLADLLWPDEQADTAIEDLRVALHRLRKILRHDDVIRVQGGSLSLDTSSCWTDVAAFDAAVDHGPSDEDAAVAFSLYRGQFLGDEGDEPWALATRERLKSGFIRFVAAHGSRLEQAGRHEEALAAYQRGIDVDSLVEALHCSVMRCCERLGRHAEGMAAYRRLRQTLSIVLGIRPSPESESLFQHLQRSRAG